MTALIQIPVTERSEVAEARRRCVAVAHSVGFDETEAGRMAIVATELATNLVRHAQGGELLCGVYEDRTGAGIEILSIDRGPGMDDVAACLRDGYSTGGSSGHGLGAVRRQTAVFDMASRRGAGTVIHARLVRGPLPQTPPPAMPPHPRWGAICVAKAGEDVCGDAWAALELDTGLVCMVADGLGHGPEAAAASMEAVRQFVRRADEPLPVLLDSIHNGLRATRGAAVSIVRQQPQNRVEFAGIGNVSGLIADGAESRRMVSMNGTAGHNARRIQSFDYPLGAGPIVLHSDGVSASWSFSAYAEYASRHPTLLAGLIYRDHSRARDDATVVVLRPESPT